MIDNFLAHLYKHKPLQRKKIRAFFEHTPKVRQEFGEFLVMYRPIWEQPDIGGLEGLAAAYSRVVGEMMGCRLDFMRTGTYSTSQTKTVENVYSNTGQMLPYMLGVAVSQFLWVHHYQLFSFLKECIKTRNPSGRFLEVGSGHGLFLNYLMSKVNPDAVIDIVDISATSISLTKALLAATYPEALQRVHFIESDIALYKAPAPYDFIIMGEVLEHVESPDSILRSLKPMLSDNGALYITTCANCPAIDHVYLFHSIDEIRTLIHESGFVISEEIIVPSHEGESLEYHVKNKLDISYGALLELRNSG